MSEGGIRSRMAAYVAEHREVHRFMKFAVVGAIGAVVDSLCFNLLQRSGVFETVSLDLVFFDLTEIGISGAIAFILAVISNFLWNRYWTYPDSRSKSIVKQFLMFFLINAFGILIRIPILEFASPPLSRLAQQVLPALTQDNALWLGSNGAWVIAVLVVMMWNFFVNRRITYNDVE